MVPLTVIRACNCRFDPVEGFFRAVRPRGQGPTSPWPSSGSCSRPNIEGAQCLWRLGSGNCGNPLPSLQREVSCLRRCIDGLLTQHVYQLRRCLVRCKILDTLRRSIYPEGLLKREWLIEAEQLVDFDTDALGASLVVSKKPCS
jgi:hypothetical protein